MKAPAARFNSRLEQRHRIGSLFYGLFITSIAVGIVGLVVLVTRVLVEGIPWLNWGFISSYPAPDPSKAGILSALMGTIWITGLTAAFTVPVGLGAALYLEEYAAKNMFTKFVEVNISNLAGVPSIIYGLLGLALFVYWLNMGRSVLAGALTLSLLVMPIVIMASREAIRAVPDSHRQAAYALGATQWEVVKGVVLPSAFPGILSGTILAMSRAIGEAAPLLAISALVYITFVPSDPFDRFTVLPIQIYNWASRPQDDFRGLAAAGIIVLLIILLSMNSIAIYLRNRYQTRSED